MQQILEMLSQQLSGSSLSQLSQSIGADEGSTQKGIQAAIPAILGGLGRNASNPEGAQALQSALEKDHDGSWMDDQDNLVQNAQGANGAGILKHVFGEQVGGVQNALAGKSGLGQDQMGQLMQMLAPMVMGSLGKTQRAQGLDAQGLGGFLAGGQGGNIMSAVTQMLDQNKDGNIMDDAMNILGGFFKR